MTGKWYAPRRTECAEWTEERLQALHVICKQYLTLHTEQPFTKLALLGWFV